MLRPVLDIFAVDGHDVWIDAKVLVGQTWQEVLAEQIGRCDVFVYAAATGSVRSGWCKWELAKAGELRKPVLPVLLESGVSMPDPLKKLQWADCSKGITGLEGAKLIRALDHLQKIPAADVPPLPAAPEGVPSRGWDIYARVMDGVFNSAFYEPIEGEKVIETYLAARAIWWDGVDGRLSLTNRRVLFEARRLTAFRRHFSIAIQLSDIESVVVSKKWGIFPVVTIRCQSGKEHQFRVPTNTERVISKIEEQRKRVQKLA
jgi:hypothetical protein